MNLAELLQMVYFQNIKASQMAAKYDMLYRNRDEYPYWQYVAILDGKTRPAHLALHGKIFRADDPFWNTAFPPNGFNCRCNVKPLSSDDVKGMKIENGGSIFFQPDKGFANNPGKDLEWIEQKQEEAIKENKAFKIVEPKINFEQIIKKEGLKNDALLIDVPDFNPGYYKDKKYTQKYIDDFCKKYNFKDEDIDLVDYKGKVIKMNFRKLIRHIVEDGEDEKEAANRVSRLKFIRFVPDILKDPDLVAANIYVKNERPLRTKVSKVYVKKINSEGKDSFVVVAINYDRENPAYRGATLFLAKDTKGWIVK